MSVLQTYGPVRRRILSPYLIVWVVAAAVAIGYLVLLGVRPEIFARARTDVAQELAQTKRDMTRAMADIDPLRKTVGEIKLDVANLSYGTKDLATHQAELNDRVTALEAATPKVARIGEATTDSAPVPQPVPVPAKKAAAPKQTKTGSAVVAPLPGAKVINGNKPAAAPAVPAETGSIAAGGQGKAAAKTQVAAAHKPPAKPAPVGVLLATGPSVDALKLNWSILKDQHADAVGNLSPRVVVSGPASKRVYSLVAGPIASADQAKNLCVSMAAKGVGCEVSTFRGSAL